MSLRRRFHWISLPSAVLVTLLQRTPVVRVATAAGELAAVSRAGQILRGLFTAATLGAMHSRAGATTYVQEPMGIVNGTVGTPVSVAFTYTGTPSAPARFLVTGGSLPPGMNFIPGVANSVILSGSPAISGTPTQGGEFSVFVQGTNAEGLTNGVQHEIRFDISGGSGPAAPTVTAQPSSQAPQPGASVTLTAAASGTPAPTFQWQQNGTNVGSASANGTLTLQNLQPANAGLYQAVINNTGGSVLSSPAIVGLTSDIKLVGPGTEFPDIPHPNTNIFDQILIGGAAVTIKADAGQAVRMSYIDLNNDIVQVEFSGAGTLSLVFDNPSGPAVPTSYNQPTVSYMKGHATIVITGANETTNVGVFSVGRSTAFDPTGTYNILQGVSATNVPANNGSPLFAGHASTVYDGLADIALIAISSTNGQFGGLRCANASFFATKGFTGIYAPGVQFVGPMFMGELSASGTATPVIMIGGGNDTRITGGDLAQANGQAVQVSGLAQLRFTAGSDSHGNLFAAKNNQAQMVQNGVNVTAQIVVNP